MSIKSVLFFIFIFPYFPTRLLMMCNLPVCWKCFLRFCWKSSQKATTMLDQTKKHKADHMTSACKSGNVLLYSFSCSCFYFSCLFCLLWKCLSWCFINGKIHAGPPERKLHNILYEHYWRLTPPANLHNSTSPILYICFACNKNLLPE